MKNTAGLIVLILLCLGLVVGLIVIKKDSSEQKEKDTTRIQTLSNNVVSLTSSLEEQKQVSLLLEKDLEKQKVALTEVTNNLTRVSGDLAQTSANLAQTQAALQASKEETAKRDAKINELEVQNQALDKQALDLSNAITNLTTQITATEKRLAASEGDKAFLEKELRRLTSEKAELERQFNDLAVLRAQVAKLKEELNIARRIEWIRQGLFASSDQKGAQKLMQGVTVPQPQPKQAKPAYDLNVEVTSDGSVKVVPPTNSPAK